MANADYFSRRTVYKLDFCIPSAFNGCVSLTQLVFFLIYRVCETKDMSTETRTVSHREKRFMCLIL